MDGSRRDSDSYAAYRSVAGLGASPQEFMAMALDSLERRCGAPIPRSAANRWWRRRMP